MPASHDPHARKLPGVWRNSPMWRFKATGVPHYSKRGPYPFSGAANTFSAAGSTMRFGPNRMFLGHGHHQMPCSWRQCVGRCSPRSYRGSATRNKRLIMGEALCALVGLGPGSLTNKCRGRPRARVGWKSHIPPMPPAGRDSDGPQHEGRGPASGSGPATRWGPSLRQGRG